MLKAFYERFVLKYPLAVSILSISAILLFGLNAKKLEIDASAETLLLEGDKDLAFMRKLEKHFNSDDILVIAYRPKEKMLSKSSIDTLVHLTAELEKLPSVSSVDSIVNVPLLFSPIRGMSDLIKEKRTLTTPDINMTMAKHELLTSPLYRDSLVNKSFTVSAIVLHLKKDRVGAELIQKRDYLRKKRRDSSLTPLEETELKKITKQIKNHRDTQRIKASENIKMIRSIMKKYSSQASLFLGGVQMISNDIIGFVKSDLVVYGSILILLLILILGVVFKKLKWVAIPILICTLSVIAITAVLGYWGWEITVISSNFIALQLIITISIILHLIVRYEELRSKYPRASKRRVVLDTMLSKATPTFFAIITTIAGFSSLLFSGILPVISLGWMMSAGIILSFIISYIVFPAIVVLL